MENWILEAGVQYAFKGQKEMPYTEEIYTRVDTRTGIGFKDTVLINKSPTASQELQLLRLVNYWNTKSHLWQYFV